MLIEVDSLYEVTTSSILKMNFYTMYARLLTHYFCECDGGTLEYCRFDKACYTSSSLSLYLLDIEPDVCLCDFYYIDTI